MKITTISSLSLLSTPKTQPNIRVSRFQHNNLSDKVAFGAKKNIIEREFEEFDAMIQNDIEPFIKDSKELYFKIGNQGLKLQELVDLYRTKETGMGVFKCSLFGTINSPKIEKLDELIKTTRLFNHNIDRFLQINNMQNNSKEVSAKLDKKINQNKKYFFVDEMTNNYLNEIKGFVTTKQSLITQFDEDLNKVTLKDINQNLYSDIAKLKDAYMALCYFMMQIPCNDAMSLLKKHSFIKAQIAQNNYNSYEILKFIESAQNEAQRIINDKKLFYANRDDIAKSSVEIEKVISDAPSCHYINSEYDKMLKICMSLKSSYCSKLDKLAQNIGTSHFEFHNKIEKMINKQDKVLDELSNIIYQNSNV